MLRLIHVVGLSTAAFLLGNTAWAAATTTEADQASAFESAALVALVKNLAPAPNWIAGSDRFWVKNESAEGTRFLVVDTADGKQEPAFDHAGMAASLTAAGVENVNAEALPIMGLDFKDGSIHVTTAAGVLRCTLDASSCQEDDTPAITVAERASPDGSRIAFIRDHNLWLRDAKTREERALTTDGVEGFAYGRPEMDMGRVTRRRSQAPDPLGAVNWSPDGRFIAAMRSDLRAIDQRNYVTEHLPPDGSFTISHMDYVVVAADRIEPVREISVTDTTTGRTVKATIDPGKLQDFASIHFGSGLVWWALGQDASASELFFVTAEHGGQTYGIAGMNLSTGNTRTVVEESEEHYYAFNARDYNAPNFYVSTDGTDAIFYSQRSGAGQLYRYDARTGKLKNAITSAGASGSGVVFDLIRVDEEERQVYFTAGGREKGRDPYYAHLYRAPLDGGKAELLTPEDASHQFFTSGLVLAGSFKSPSQFAPSGNYFVDVYSTLEQPPVMVIREKNGKQVSEVLRADITALEATGWKPPQRFVVKAADGKTDLYGAIFKPKNFDPKLKYAVVDQTYPGPQIDSGPHGFMDNFYAITTRNAQATAEAGFVVVALDGRGTTGRDRAYRYAFAGTEDIFGAADHKAAIENLAQEYSWVDAGRVGITGASFGGYGSLRAALLYPEFFKVVVSHVGPPEYLNSVTFPFSVERFFGVPGTERDYFELSSNIALIDRLEADLMLVYGEIDENVPFRSAMAIFDALIKADKDFTSYVVPNANHAGAAGSPYIVKRERRFFQEHLGGPVSQE
jgi:dipeptidyl aminopeptidase/acylaminoacyl peptidase